MTAVSPLLTLALLLACLPALHATSVWNQPRGSPQQSNSVAVNGSATSCNIAWNTQNADLILNCQYWSTFVTDGSRIFVVSYNETADQRYWRGNVAALNANTGAVVWSSVIGEVEFNNFLNMQPLFQQVVVSPSAGLVFVLGDVDVMSVFNAATGAALWSFRLPTRTLNSFILDDSEDTLLLLNKYNITAYSVSKRSFAWTTQLFRFDCTQAAVNTSANYVAVMCSTELKVFRLSDGAQLWSINTPEQDGLIALDTTCIYAQYYGRSPLHGVPLVDCYDPQSGRLLWQRNLRDEHAYRTEGGYNIGPIATSKGVVVGTPDNHGYMLRLLDPQTGLDKWRYSVFNAPTSIVADGASVLYLSYLFAGSYSVAAVPVGGTQAWNASFTSWECDASVTVIGNNSLALVSSYTINKSETVFVPTISLVNTNTANQACPVQIVS